MLVKLNDGSTVNARLYAFPKKGNAPEGFSLMVNGEKVAAATTGGGKFPSYTYFMYNGVSFYLPKNVMPASGENLEVVVEAPKPAATPDVPAKPAKPARAPKVSV